MKICLFFIIVFLLQTAQADDILGEGRYFIKIKKNHDSTEVYVKNYKGQQFLLYKANFIYLEGNGIATLQEGDVLSVNFFCEERRTCWRFFNRRTNQLSDVYFGDDLIDYNTKKDMLVVYEQNKNFVTFKNAFKTCKKPLYYQLMIAPGSDFRVTDSRLKPNGELRLDYKDPIQNEEATLIISIDYPLFVKNCG